MHFTLQNGHALQCTLVLRPQVRNTPSSSWKHIHCKSELSHMDATTSSGASSSLPLHLIVDDTLSLVSPLQQSYQRSQRHCLGDSAPGEFPLAANPSIVLHVLTSCNLEPEDLAHLEASSILLFLSMIELILPLMSFVLVIGNMQILQEACQFPSWLPIVNVGACGFRHVPESCYI
jgi:hypothetical protein